MKSIVLILVFGLSSLATMAQEKMEVRCVVISIISSSPTSSQMNMQIMVAGSGAKDIQHIEVVNKVRATDGRIISRLPLYSTVSNEGNGHVWNASLNLGGLLSNGTYQNTAIISVRTVGGEEKQYELQYGFGSGTKNSTTLVSTKPRLL